jgi:class 3 adenylate cyclase
MTPPVSASSSPAARIAGVLFADAVGFSRLSDAQVERFVRDFLGAVGALADTAPNRPLFRNTWGDGLYFQFDDVTAAGLFALSLSEMVSATDWTQRGLPADMGLRVALHAGPLFAYPDPVTGQHCLWGRHVIRAARIEPVTPPGRVYASREFAALSAAHKITAFDCEPVGRTQLAKAFDDMPLYLLRRRGR